LFTDISDHLPIFSTFSEQQDRCNVNTYFVVRDKKQLNVINFLDQLRNTNWENLDEYNNSVNAYGSFLHKYTALFNECFPLKHIKASKHCLTKPWISKCLLKSIRKKNRLYRKFLKFPTSQNEINYKQYRNNLSSLLRTAKRLHYEEKLSLAKTNVKKTWQVLNEILQRRGNKANKIPSNFFTNNRNISDPMEIANLANS
jgi:hypothetical protein